MVALNEKINKSTLSDQTELRNSDVLKVLEALWLLEVVAYQIPS